MSRYLTGWLLGYVQYSRKQRIEIVKCCLGNACWSSAVSMTLVPYFWSMVLVLVFGMYHLGFSFLFCVFILQMKTRT